jgi:hypothetical protein
MNTTQAQQEIAIKANEARIKEEQAKWDALKHAEIVRDPSEPLSHRASAGLQYVGDRISETAQGLQKEYYKKQFEEADTSSSQEFAIKADEARIREEKAKWDAAKHSEVASNPAEPISTRVAAGAQLVGDRLSETAQGLQKEYYKKQFEKADLPRPAMNMHTGTELQKKEIPSPPSFANNPGCQWHKGKKFSEIETHKCPQELKYGRCIAAEKLRTKKMYAIKANEARIKEEKAKWDAVKHSEIAKDESESLTARAAAGAHLVADKVAQAAAGVKQELFKPSS